MENSDGISMMYTRAAEALRQAQAYRKQGNPASESAAAALAEEYCARIRAAAEASTPSRPNARSGVARRRFRLYRMAEGGSWEAAGSGSAADLAAASGLKPSRIYSMARRGMPSRDGVWRVEELRTPGF